MTQRTNERKERTNERSIDRTPIQTNCRLVGWLVGWLVDVWRDDRPANFQSCRVLNVLGNDISTHSTHMCLHASHVSVSVSVSEGEVWVCGRGSGGTEGSE